MRTQQQRSEAARRASETRRAKKEAKRAFESKQYELRMYHYDAMSDEAQEQIRTELVSEATGNLEDEMNDWFEGKVSDAQDKLRGFLRNGFTYIDLKSALEDDEDAVWQCGNYRLDLTKLLDELVEDEFEFEDQERVIEETEAVA